MEEEPIRVRIPGQGELLGVVEQLLGNVKFRIRCADGKVRICRVPGKLRRRLWIRPGNIVLVKPWDVQTDTRGDVLFRYNPTHVSWLRRRGFLKPFEVEL